MEQIVYEAGGIRVVGGFLKWQERTGEAILRDLGVWSFEKADPKIKNMDPDARARAFARLHRDIDSSTVVRARLLIGGLLHHLASFDGDKRMVSYEGLKRSAVVLARENRIAADCPMFKEGILEPLGEKRAMTLLVRAASVLIEEGIFAGAETFTTRSATGRTGLYSIQQIDDNVVITLLAA